MLESSNVILSVMRVFYNMLLNAPSSSGVPVEHGMCQVLAGFLGGLGCRLMFAFFVRSVTLRIESTGEFEVEKMGSRRIYADVIYMVWSDIQFTRALESIGKNE